MINEFAILRHWQTDSDPFLVHFRKVLPIIWALYFQQWFEMSAKWNRKFEKKVKNTKIKKRRKTEFPVKKDFFGIEKGSKKLKEIKKNSFWIFNYFVAKNKLSKNNPSTDWNCVKIHPSPNWNISNRIQYFIKVLLVFIRFDSVHWATLFFVRTSIFKSSTCCSDVQQNFAKLKVDHHDHFSEQCTRQKGIQHTTNFINFFIFSFLFCFFSRFHSVCFGSVRMFELEFSACLKLSILENDRKHTAVHWIICFERSKNE